METPLDLQKIKQVLPASALVISDNDPFDAFDFNKQKFTELGSTIVELRGAGHITGDDGFVEAPVLLDTFCRLIEKA